MGLRFRRRIRLLPGIWLNLSKTGISASIGERGATLNVKGDRVRATVGLPGSGLSYSTDLHSPQAQQPPQAQRAGSVAARLFWIVVVLVAIGVAANLFAR